MRTQRTVFLAVVIVWSAYSTHAGVPELPAENRIRGQALEQFWDEVVTPQRIQAEMNRMAHTVAWTGTEMIVWGGRAPASSLRPLPG